MINIVLHEPEMPANTGNIGRTCVATGVRLHLIGPLGFQINDKMLKRAGLDYWDKLDVTEYDDYKDFLAKNTGAKLHICHVSTEDSVRMIAAAKKEGLDVTAEVTPHHLTLTEDDINEDDANYKVNPPLRTNKDKDMLIKGLKDGTIDIIATDHAPHHLTEKDRGFVEAPFGISGLETAVAIIMTDLVKKNVITPLEMADKMSYTPAKIIGIDKGTLLVGKTAE